jgi:hypothetical protein
MQSWPRPILKGILFSVSALLLTQCKVMGPPAAPPHVMVLPVSRFAGIRGHFGNATQVVVHRSVPAHKLETAFPSSKGYAWIFSPLALRLVKESLNDTTLTATQRQQLTATKSELSYFEQRRQLAVQSAAGSGPQRFRMLQRATYQ